MDKKQKKRVEKIIYAGFRLEFAFGIFFVLAMTVLTVQVTKCYLTSGMNGCVLNGILTTYYELLIATSAFAFPSIFLARRTSYRL